MKRFSPVIACTIALLALGACSKPQPEADKAEESASSEAEPAEADESADYDDLKGDVAAGAVAFAQCKVCHAMEEGKNGIGPSLHKVVGRAATGVAGYAYSPGMKSSGITWTEDKIFTYLEKPQAVVPGTKMSFAGYSDPQKRADVIAWIKANGGS